VFLEDLVTTEEMERYIRGQLFWGFYPGVSSGGGMWVAPEARVNDGLLNITIIGNYSLPEIFWHLPKLYNGRLFQLKKVRGFTAGKVEAWSEERVLLDVDGEQPGVLPVTAEVVPSALRLIVPKGVGSKQ